ncbi:MAG: MipA/OmpV family protein [Pseudomonadota bacterium]
MLLSPGALANPGSTPTAIAEAASSRWRFAIALGYGLRSNPLIQSDDIPIIVDLDIAWFGDRFFFDNGDVGLTLSDNRMFTLDFVTRVNSERVFFGRTDTQFVSFAADGSTLATPVLLEVPDRDFAVEAGIELLTDGDWGELQLTAFRDVSATHGGYELFVDYAYRWRHDRWVIKPSLGVSYHSRSLNDYYWGVTADEAAESAGALPQYRLQAGINAHARLAAQYIVSKHWSFAAALEYERMNDDAAQSPIVAQRSVRGYFAGMSYRF